MEFKWIDDAFRAEEMKYGLWHSYDKEGKCLITALNEEQCIRATRFYLKLKQDEKHGIKLESKTYSGTVDGKL